MEVERAVAPIPKDYRSSLSLFGIPITAGRAIESATVMLLFAFPSFFIARYAIDFELSLSIGISLSLGIPPAALSIAGIDGDSLFEFIVHLVKEKKSRGSAYYNPRIKTEAKPYGNDDDEELLPRDRIIALYRNIVAKNDANEAKNASAKNDNLEEIIFIEDELLKKKRSGK